MHCPSSSIYSRILGREKPFIHWSQACTGGGFYPLTSLLTAGTLKYCHDGGSLSFCPQSINDSINARGLSPSWKSLEIFLTVTQGNNTYPCITGLGWSTWYGQRLLLSSLSLWFLPSGLIVCPLCPLWQGEHTLSSFLRLWLRMNVVNSVVLQKGSSLNSIQV